MKPTFTRLGRLFVFVFFHCSLVLSAQIGPGIAPVSSPSGGFNIDGTLSSNSAIGDWVSGTGSGGFVLANSGTPLNIKTTYHLYDEYNSSTDNIFGGGDKVSDNPNSMSWTLGTANNKTDMNNALIHFTTDANGNVWFVFAADRLSNSGNAYIDFEFLQDELTKTATGFASTGSSVTGGRTQGDFLLTVYFENGAANFDIQHWENVSGTWQYKTYFSSLPLNSVYAAGNSTTVPVPYSAFGTNSYPQNTFIESAVNLTEVLGAIDPCANLKIKTIFVKSKTSTAPSASIKDFFEPLAVTNLTLGSADAGDDDTICSGGNYKLQGAAVPSSNYTVVSTTWSVLSGSATIASPTTLDSYVTINGSSATLRLTVETHPSNGIGTHCIVYDDVTITTTPSPSCSITGSNGPLCPSTIANNYAAPVSSSYSWSISGNGTLSGSTTSQTASVTAGQNCNASFTLTLNTTDANGCTSECTKTVAVNDTNSPIITTTIGTLNHTLQCNNASGIASALMEVPTATDNCSATPTMHLVSDVTTPTTDCANGYSRVRTWNFTDDCGNTSANFVQTITVIDDIAPIVSTTSGTLNHTLKCDNASGIESALAEIPTATDNCSATPTMHLVSDVTTPTTDCANGYSRVRTWNFTDGCGNTSDNFVQTITVIDDVAPVVTTTSGTLNHTLQCNNTSGIESALMEVPTATDNCSATPTMHLVSDVTTPTTDCANEYSRVRTWNFTDGCGNTSANFVQTITVIDDVAPVVTTISGTLNHTLQCNNASGIESALMEVPTANDNCSTTLTMHLVSDVTTPTTDCANGYSRVRTWNFTDGCGNTSDNFVQEIIVQDTIAPTFVEIVPNNTTVECNTIPIPATLTAIDNCSEAIVVFSESELPGSCPGSYTINRTWTATDSCGNQNSHTQIITVKDTTAPTFIAPVDITLTSDSNCYADISTTSTGVVTNIKDNCDPNPITSYEDSDCFGNFNSASVNSGTGNYFPFTVSGFDSITANNIKKVALAFETNQGKGRAEFVLVAPNGQGIVLVAPYCKGGDCDNLTSSEKELYLPVFYPNSSNYPKWDNSNPIVTNSIQNFTPNGMLSTTNTITGLSSLVSSFEEFTGDLNGNWFVFARKDGTEEGRIEFKSICLTPSTNLCGSNTIIVRKWSVSDACSNTVTFNQIIKIVDTIAPTWITEVGSLNTSIECSDEQALANAQNLVPIASDNCDKNLSNIVKVAGEFVASSTCATTGTYTNTWTVTDSCGNTSANYVQTITVIDDVAPVVTTTSGTLNHTLQCNNTSGIESALMEVPTASDNCSATLTMHLVSDVTTPTTDCANGYSRVRTWNFTDGCGNTSANFVQTITVIDDIAPIVSTTSGTLNHTLQCNNTNGIASALMEVPTANDNCSATPTIHLVSDVTTPTTDCTNGYSRVRTWNFTDGCRNTSANFVQTITVIDDVAPIVTTTSGTLNHTLKCDNASGIASALMEVPTATDNCSATPTIHLVSDVTTPTTDCANGYSRVRTWNFTDDCGNTSANYVQEIIVQDTTAPIWITQVGSLNTTIECNDAQALANAQNSFPIASDNCDTTLNNSKKTAGEFVASSTCANSGTYTNTWTVTDDCGNNSETFTQVITIQDSESPKMITKATDIVVECDGQGNQNAITNWLANNGGAIASDNCSEIIWTNNFNSIANDCSAAVTVVFTATDACGNSTSTSGTFSVQDNTPPTVPDSPASITVGCAAEIPEMISLTANDNCSGNITVEGINTIELGDCDATYTIKRTWTFRDACNNISTVSQTINVVDTTAPTIAQLPEPSTISCPNTPIFAQATATDECGLNFSLTFKDVKTEGNCAGSYSITRTWTAADSCGNSTTASQTITVQDTAGPVFSSLPEPTTISCPSTPVFAFATATDECGSDFSLTFNDVKTEGNCAGSYSITRTWTATDTCGNSATASQKITVEDTTGPITTTEFSTNTTANCDAIPAKPELVFVDNCSAVSPVSFSETISNLTADSYVINRKWIVSDSCGNASEFVQTINVTITNSLTSLSGTICNDGETTSIDLTSLFPVGTPTNGTWTDVSNTGKLVGNTFNAASLSVGDYLFEYIINDTNCPRTIRITMSVTTGCGGIVLPCGTIVVHNAFSPNGDGINEKFVIDNINDTNCYPDNTVEIYNRWGVLVYSTKGYNNTTNAFDGISDGRSTVSQSSGLPAGTYFYILTYTSFDNNNVIQTNKKEGYLFLTK